MPKPFECAITPRSEDVVRVVKEAVEIERLRAGDVA
jgi:hypothetical protein